MSVLILVATDYDAEVDIEFGMSQDKDITKPSKKPYEVDFTVFEPTEIQAHQEKQIDEVSSILGQPPEVTAILLRHTRWNKEKLIETYMDRQEELLEQVGLEEWQSERPPALQRVRGFVCDICCDDDPNLDTFAMKCGHRFCAGCYTQYLSQKIKEEGEAARIKCPGDGCNRIVDSKSLDLLVANDLKGR